MRCRRNSLGIGMVLLAGAALAGCAAPPLPPATKAGVKAGWAQTDGVQYRCAGDRGFVANFSPDGQIAAIKLGESIYEVPEVESGSGIRYRSDEIDFIGKGRDAQLLQSPEGSYADCRAVAGE